VTEELMSYSWRNTCVTPLRERALAPLSRADAERLLPGVSSGRQSLERRVLRARCLKYFESFDLAWAELSEVLPQIHDPLLEARVAVDLLHLSYYLVRREDSPRLQKLAERNAAQDPFIQAELQLGISIVLTAQNEVTEALVRARRCEDALQAAPKGRSRDLVATRVSRQLAHLLSHSGDYVDATTAAEDHAHLALLRGETDVADRILTRAPQGFPEDEQFRNDVRAIVRAQKGDPRGGVRMLDETAKEFEARGMAHWALGAAVHAAYWRESLVRGGGVARAVSLVRDIGARGGEGFAYYLPEVAAWLGRSAERDSTSRELARKIRARADAALRRAETDSATAVGASAL